MKITDATTLGEIALERARLGIESLTLSTIGFVGKRRRASARLAVIGVRFEIVGDDDIDALARIFALVEKHVLDARMRMGLHSTKIDAALDAIDREAEPTLSVSCDGEHAAPACVDPHCYHDCTCADPACVQPHPGHAYKTAGDGTKESPHYFACKRCWFPVAKSGAPISEAIADTGCIPEQKPFHASVIAGANLSPPKD